MATMTIKNMPDDLYAALKETAAANRRSLNSQAILCLERAVQSTRIDTRRLLSRIRARRARLEGIFVTDADIDEAKREGRE